MSLISSTTDFNLNHFSLFIVPLREAFRHNVFYYKIHAYIKVITTRDKTNIDRYY